MADLTITELQEDTTLTGTEEVPIWDSGTTKKATLDAIKTFVGASAGVSDHGALTGLGDDDHPHYFNETRGDARYSQLAHNHSGVYEPADVNILKTSNIGVSVAAQSHTHSYQPLMGADDNYVTDAEKTALHGHNNKSTLDKITESAGEPLWNGSAWPGGGTGTGDMLASVYDPDADGKISYNDLEDKPTLGTAAFQSATAFAPASHSHAQSDITNLVTDLAGKQATLVAGTNIKTINGQSPLGGGDIVINGGMANPMSAAGDIIYGGTAGAATRLAKGTDGQVLTLASGLPTWSTVASGGTTTSDLLVAEIIVSSGTSSGKTFYVGGGSAVSSIDFTGLPVVIDGGFEFEILWKNAASGARQLVVYVNGITSPYHGGGSYTGLSFAAGGDLQQNYPAISYAGQAFTVYISGSVVTHPSSTGSCRIESVSVGHDPTHSYYHRYAAVGPEGMAAINQLTFALSDSSVNIGVSSVFRIYKRK